MSTEINKKNYCPDCELPKSSHIQNWLNEIIDGLLITHSSSSLSREREARIDIIIEKLFFLFRLAKLEHDFPRDKIQLRSSLFISEARKHGWEFKVIRGRFGYTNHFQMSREGKTIRFDGLPLAEFANTRPSAVIDDKEQGKKLLQQGGFPVATGRSFRFWQINKALDFGEKQIGFPLVVKPRHGSVSRHVTTDIRTRGELAAAIRHAIHYAPSFIIEKFIEKSLVHRATIIDFNFVACAKQIPAHVIGNGADSIRKLIATKNNDPRRDGKFLHQLQLNAAALALLEKNNYTLDSIPAKDETIYLQNEPFMRLGGDIAEVTNELHPDNRQLFIDIAKFFGIRVIGLDFLISDISQSWKNQACAVLELNSLPCIEMHHIPTYGEPQDAAAALYQMTLKYYL